VEHLVDRQVQSFAAPVVRVLPRLDQLALGVLHLHRDGVDADDLLDVLAVLGVALETDGIALDQQLEDHVLDEGGDAEPVGELYRLPLHVLVVAGDLDLVAHCEGAPGVDAVLHQRLLDVVLPRLAGALLPGRRDGLGGVHPAEDGGVQGRGRRQRDDEHALGLRILRPGGPARRGGWFFRMRGIALSFHR